MSSNPFDQACRYLAKLDAEPFLAWLLGLPADRVGFVRWLDTRLIRFPGEPDRTCDTVAHLEDLAAGHTPWAVVVEFQMKPDPLMPGRLLGYLGPLWLEQKPAAEPGDRFHLGAVVVNLTGRGDASRTMDWLAAGLRTELRVREVNLAELDAAATLAEIAAGRVPRVILPLLPLMRGGGEAGMIEQWKAVAEAEPDPRRRGDLGGLALVFADAADRWAEWKRALEGWNVIQSRQVLEWQNEAAVRARQEETRDLLLDALQTRFSDVPADLAQQLQAIDDLARLRHLHRRAIQAASLDEFRQELGNGAH